MKIGRFTTYCCLLSTLVFAVPSWASDPFAELDSAVKSQRDNLANEDKGFEAYKAAQRASFQAYMKKVREEFEAYRKIYQKASEDYRTKVAKVWKAPETSSKKRWVQYEQDYKFKTVVDFDKERIVFSWPRAAEQPLTESAARQKLEQLLILTRKQAFARDEVAQQVEMIGRDRLSTFETADVQSTPILMTYLFGTSQVDASTRQRLVESFMKRRRVSVGEEAGQPITSWIFPLELPPALASNESLDVEVKKDNLEDKPVPPKATPPASGGFSGAQAPDIAGQPIWHTATISAQLARVLPRKAQSFVEAINRENQTFDLSAELILAIIETESAFNPMAKSPIPAYGLMQIVPQSAGKDATAKIFGRPRILSPSYLYNSDNNIKVGAAYFNILFYRASCKTRRSYS